MTGDRLAAAWEQAPDDPDLVEHLGYPLLELEFISSATGSDHVIVLPKNESLLKDDAFLVAGTEQVVELSEHT